MRSLKLQTGFILVFLLVNMVSPAIAQTGVGETFYVIQPGDTLTAIALRFGTTVNLLVGTNELSDPNDIDVGQTIQLPGVDWVSGLIDRRDVPFGETFRSIQRRYKLDTASIVRLSALVSPDQLYVGYPLLLATGRGERLDGARDAVGSGGTLLEMAAANNTNPWALVNENILAGTWQALPGDVLFTGGEGSGPGALPSPISQLTITPSRVTQGKTHLFEVSAGGQSLTLSGALMDHKLTFFPSDDGLYVALQGVHALTEPGLYPLSIGGILANGVKFEVSQMVYVNEYGYPSEALSVDENYLESDVSDQELAMIQEMIAPVSPDKLWTGYFIPPSPYPDVINSVFGTRRSFNNSGFIYYHAGTDFGGGTGVEVFAPANGVVVFAAPLEIRGNATIIDHGWGIYTGYWHQSELYVSVGEVVSPGQVIGLVGNTGRSTGAHLHWELWVGGVQVEPLDWLYILYP